MILYNITFGIEKSIEGEWKEWMKTKHIPNMMGTQLFSEYRFFKVLSGEEGDNPSYCIQYLIPTIEEFQQYLDQFSGIMMKDLDKYKGEYAAFQTLLEEV